MSTDFDSFDRSPLGEFTRSLLGARNELPRPLLIVGMTWIDESSPYATDRDLYLAELGAFRDFLGTNDDIDIRPVMMKLEPFDQPNEFIIPPGELFPSDIFSLVEVSRESPAALYLAIFDGIRNFQRTDGLTIDTDESGSTVRSQLQPGLGSFISEVQEEHPDMVFFDHPFIAPHEQWLTSMQSALAELITLVRAQ